MVSRKPDVAVINSDVVSALDSLTHTHAHTLGQDSTSKMLHLTGSSAVTQVKRHCTGGTKLSLVTLRIVHICPEPLSGRSSFI